MVGCVTDDNEHLIDDLEFLTGKQIVTIKLTNTQFREKVEEIYHDYIPLKQHGVLAHDYALVEDTANQEDTDARIEEIEVVTLVNRIITDAIDHRASDVHIENYENSFRVRYRLDGVLKEIQQLPAHKKHAIISRLKIMANLDIAEKRRPQDGRVRVERDNHVIDIRMSTLPTDFGEKVVLRILDKDQLKLNLDRLGFDERTLRLFMNAISSPYGMILVTGPTGSGKTTTLYAAMNSINSEEKNIQTIENPIEYNLSGINQSQVHNEIGYTFVTALRAFLRQDPDVIMVGEIRDTETAEIAVRASLTGHLVFSTLHTNSASDTLTRLIDMGLEPFLISSSLRIVVAQRLLRLICPECKAVDIQSDRLIRSRLRLSEDLSGVRFYTGRGCDHCSGTGYSGRSAIFEVMPVTGELIDAINCHSDAQRLHQIACEAGMIPLRESAFRLVRRGITTLDEVFREVEFLRNEVDEVNKREP